eukprot:jgi/Phyca11/60780/gw1.17.422.1
MELVCSVGLTSVPGIVTSETSMECSLPAKIPGNYTLAITCRPDSKLLAIFPIEYVKAPQIEMVAPTVVPIRGSFDVDLFATNFAPGDPVYCIFGSSSRRVPASYVSPQQARCVSRLNWLAGEVVLTVILETFEGLTQILLQSPFTFVDTIPGSAKLNPNFGSVAGGYPISIAWNNSWGNLENCTC